MVIHDSTRSYNVITMLNVIYLAPGLLIRVKRKSMTNMYLSMSKYWDIIVRLGCVCQTDGVVYGVENGWY
jgi:hypothetical protein